MYQFGLLRAFNRLESLFLRPSGSSRRVVLQSVTHGPKGTLAMLKKLALSFAVLLCMAILGGTAQADNIPIANPSFEASSTPLTYPCGIGCSYNYGPIPGWTTGAGSGVFQPGAYFNSIPDGNLVGFVNLPYSFSQTLTGNAVLPNSVYTFSVFVGERTDGLSGIYTISLDTILNGVTNTLCTITGNANTITRGTFQLESCSYTSLSSVPNGDLYLLFTANTGQLDVDDVSLTVQPATSVPEPSSMLLLSFGMLFLLSFVVARRKKALPLPA